jgi:hypothetical protein
MLAAQSRMFVGGDSGRRHVLAGSLLLTRGHVPPGFDVSRSMEASRRTRSMEASK